MYLHRFSRPFLSLASLTVGRKFRSQVERVRILRYLARRGVVRLLPEALEIQDELAERDPVLAQLAAAAVSGLPPAGPELRCRPLG